MAQSIGNAALILGVDSKGLDQGLNQADSKISGFVGKFSGGEGGGGGLMAGISVAGPYGAALAAITGGLQSAWSSVSSFYNNFKNKAFETYEQIKQQSKQASQVGLSTSQFQGFLAGAKVDADTLTGSLGHMQRSISEFGQGGLAATETFSRLGLSATDLSGTTEQQFKKIADTIANIKNPADQAAAAFRVFGRTGIEMLPAMREGLQNNIDKASKLGLVLSDEDNFNMKHVASSWSQIARITEGIWKQFYAAVAPIFGAIADTILAGWQLASPIFTKAAQILKWFSSVAVAVFEEIKASVKPVIDTLVNSLGGDFNVSVQSVTAGLQVFAVQAAQGVGQVLRIFQNLAVFMVDTFGPVVLNVGEALIKIQRFVAPSVIFLQNLYIKFANVVISVFQTVAGKINEAILFTIDKMASLFEAMSGRFDIGGVNEAMAKTLRKVQQGGNEMQKMLDGAAPKIPEIDATAVDKGLEGMQDKIKTMREKLPDLVKAMSKQDFSPEAIDGFMNRVFERVNKAKKAPLEDMVNEIKEPLGKQKQGEDKLAGAFAKGSADAAKIEYAALFGDTGKADANTGILKKGNDQRDKGNGLLEKVIDAIKNNPALELGVV